MVMVAVPSWISSRNRVSMNGISSPITVSKVRTRSVSSLSLRLAMGIREGAPVKKRTHD